MADDPTFTEVSTLGDLLVRAATLHPGRLAFVMPSVRVTYAELLAAAMDVARGLVGIGVRRGQHVGILMHNSVEIVSATFGIALAGAVAVPLHARHKGQELRYVVDNAQLVALLTSRSDTTHLDFRDVLHGALPTPDAAPALKNLVILAGEDASGFMSAAAFRAAGSAVDPAIVRDRARGVRVRDRALVIYTSGTTANPKGCMLSHEAITRGPSERARYRLASAPAGEAEVTWAAGPLYHIGSLGPLIGSIGVAGTFLSDVFYEPGRALALLSEHRVTVAWPWFSAIVQGLLDHPTFAPEPLRSLRHLFMIAPPPLVRRVEQAFPWAEILQACGMTETAGVFALSSRDEDAESRALTQGRPALGVELFIRDLAGGEGEAPLGEVGEILVRGPCVMDGYFRDPEKTAAALDAEGWLYTGDLYARQADGSVIFNGRLKDMLKVGGENVAALEVEQLLCEHPAVRLAEVVGRPDKRLDEVPVAFVELRAPVEPAELIAFCAARSASYKVPRAVYFMLADAWPMSATKVDKRALREIAKERATS